MLKQLAIAITAVILTSCAYTKVETMNSQQNNRFYYSDTDYLNYEVVGSGPTPVIFLHGFGASLRNWDDVLPLLPQETFTAYLLDLKGAGLSSKPRDSLYSIKDNADIVDSFIKQHQLRDFLIVGHSLGGAVALLIALEHSSCPETGPREMVLLDSAAYKTTLPFFIRHLRVPIFNRLFMCLTTPEFKARFTLERIVYDRSKVSPALVARYSAFMNDPGYNHALIETAIDIIPADFDEYVKRYRDIRCPVLVIWGKEDPALPLTSGQRLAQDLPNATLEVIDQCGHNPHEEFPEVVAGMISVHLRKENH